jgi:hypothetical protein
MYETQVDSFRTANVGSITPMANEAENKTADSLNAEALHA